MTRTYSPPRLHYVCMFRFMITYTSCFTMGVKSTCVGGALKMLGWTMASS
jgi:hypothetical protein